MAISNVKSAAYRSAGGYAWNKIKARRGTVIFDGPKPAYLKDLYQEKLDEYDAYLREKAKVREELSQGYDESLITVCPPQPDPRPRKRGNIKKS